MEDIKFIFTTDQQKAVAEYFGKDVNELEDYQVCELLDQLIDYVTIAKALTEN